MFEHYYEKVKAEFDIIDVLHQNNITYGEVLEILRGAQSYCKDIQDMKEYPDYVDYVEKDKKYDASKDVVEAVSPEIRKAVGIELSQCQNNTCNQVDYRKYYKEC